MSGVEESFEDRLERLARISAGAETYGAGSRFEQGTRYYLEHLVVECAERAVKNSPGLPREVELLITLTGHSPRTAILTYLVLRPKRLLVIPSEDVGDSVDAILEFVRADGRLRNSERSHRPCDPTDPMSIYEMVRDELAGHARRTREGSGDVVIDITAGRKVMSAAAALAAWQLDVRLCYVDGDYVDGRAVPGSDRLLILDNPSTLFGQPAMGAAAQSFTGGAFEAATAQFEKLAERLAKPTKARFMASLSGLYRAWCDLDLGALPAAIDRVQSAIGPVRREIPDDVQRTVFAQLDYLTTLADGDQHSLILCFSVLSDHYRDVGRYDFAALFSYRLLEACLTLRLRTLHEAFVGERMRYDLRPDRDDLRRRYTELRNAVDEGQEPRSHALPRTPGVFASALLLAALADDLVATAGLAGPEPLRRLQKLIKARNESVLAHGSRPVSKKVSSDLRVVSLDVMRACWQLSRPEEDLDARRAALRFVDVDM